MLGLSQLANINSLRNRLSVVENTKASLLHDLHWLKTLHSEKFSEISKLNLQIHFCRVEIDFARFNNHPRNYHKNIRIYDELKADKKCCLREWEEMERNIERMTDELRELEWEIDGLEERINISES